MRTPARPAHASTRGKRAGGRTRCRPGCRKRLADLKRDAQISPRPPVVLGGLLVVPRGLLDAMTGRPKPTATVDTQASAARARAIVMATERSLGFEPTDRELDKLGAEIGRPTPTARRLVEASVSPNTRRAYAGALRRLDAWLDGRELDDAALATYLAELHDAGRAASSASMAVAAACFRAKLAGELARMTVIRRESGPSWSRELGAAAPSGSHCHVARSPDRASDHSPSRRPLLRPLHVSGQFLAGSLLSAI